MKSDFSELTTAELRAQLLAGLDDFDPEQRANSLAGLLSLEEQTSSPRPAESGLVNMHLHTFYSFNARGHSPTSLAWLARQQGWTTAGIVDFDVLDGVDEFLLACQKLAVRGTAGIETRVFVPDHATREINSPGEPGICYHMGVGFASGHVPPEAQAVLQDLGHRAEQRNRAILSRVNASLDPVTVDFDDDVLPLTPGGHPTERHLVMAYLTAASHLHSEPDRFWAEALGLDGDRIAASVAHGPTFQSLVRSKLMKRGGVGYVQAHSGMFPTLDAFHEFIHACGALPCAAWLDGTSEVEREPERWLTYLIDRDVVALNIIPDRNWNIADPLAKQARVRALHEIVQHAQGLHLPLNIGTEMNAFDQKEVDDLSVPELAPLRQAFLDGAHFVYGHTQMQRALELGYQSSWAKRYLPHREQRNQFYTQVGKIIPPGKPGLEMLRSLGTAVRPAELLHRVSRPEVMPYV